MANMCSTKHTPLEQEFQTDEDGSQVYPCGFSLSVSQQIHLDLIPKTEEGDVKFLYTLLSFVFGKDLLARSTLTGRSKSGANKQQLDPVKIQCIRGNFDLKNIFNHNFFNGHFSKVLFLNRFLTKVNNVEANKRAKSFERIVNRKIQNILTCRAVHAKNISRSFKR
jgi:BEN domain